MDLVIDKAGRIVIPKPIRQELGLDAGDALELEREGETLHLRVRRSGSPLYKKHGIWVSRAAAASQPVDANAAIDQMREERIRNLAK